MQLRLRELSQPIKLFGESKPARRERLRSYMADHNIEQGMPEMNDAPEAVVVEQPVRTDQFFYKGDEALIGVRQALISDSLERAKKRLKVMHGIN